MRNGLSNHNAGQDARDTNPHAAAAPREDEDVSEVEAVSDDEAIEELSGDEIREDEPFELDFADDVDDLQVLTDDTQTGSLLLAAEYESLLAAAPSNPSRAIEALLEAKRLDAMLREVYDDE
ncbi:MAG: hypothetical protein H0V62_14100 [Gammaproteobacteria bacterium]|nr:hypothetical protein [Gammaproteobacteria bacterium]